ncbi:MAG: hypothetical protein JXA46_03955 [Dehalococcoidales bacterium]|nr:hypothetical protein [Dehalococcoidales bacterium]
MKSRWKDFIEGVGGAFLIAAAVLTPFIRYWRRWNATDEEIDRTLPGDELVSRSLGGFTHAVTISAPRSRVWSWLAQVGQGRGGFYSYDFLENLVGCNIHTVDRLYPERMHSENSEGLRLHPGMPPIPLVAIEAERVLLFGGEMGPDSPVSWVFFLEAPDENKTRLITRWRVAYKVTPVARIGFGILVPISCVMQRKMLLEIKKRAEKTGPAV